MNQFNYKDIFNNNHVAISRAISLIENRDVIVDEFYKAIYEKSNYSIRIGITGPPGAGKSTLVDQLIGRFIDSQRSVGVIAVDPSSPFTGGALLGGVAGFVLSDGERLVPCDMVAIPAYQYSALLTGREPTFQIYIKEGECIKPVVKTDLMQAQQVLQTEVMAPTKRRLSKWQRYIKVKKNKIFFKSGKRKGQLDLKRMGAAYRKGRKK